MQGLRKIRKIQIMKVALKDGLVARLVFKVCNKAGGAGRDRIISLRCGKVSFFQSHALTLALSKGPFSKHKECCEQLRVSVAQRKGFARIWKMCEIYEAYLLNPKSTFM